MTSKPINGVPAQMPCVKHIHTHTLHSLAISQTFSQKIHTYNVLNDLISDTSTQLVQTRLTYCTLVPEEYKA